MSNATLLKQLNEFNPHQLAVELAELIGKHVGGSVSAEITKFEYIPGFCNEELRLSFTVKDENNFERRPELFKGWEEESEKGESVSHSG